MKLEEGEKNKRAHTLLHFAFIRTIATAPDEYILFQWQKRNESK